MSNNDQEVKSPDKLELRGKPTTGVRFGKKAGFVIATVVFTVLGLVLYGIATREPAGTVQEGADGQPLAPGKLTAAGADAAGRASGRRRMVPPPRTREPGPASA